MISQLGQNDGLSRRSACPMPEVAVPDRVRWWPEHATEFVEAHREEWGKEHASGVSMTLRRYQHGTDRAGRPTPGIWERVGVLPIPLRACEVTAAHVLAVRDSPIWAPNTRSIYLQPLRGFLRQYGNPISESRRLWALDGTPLNRRWLTKPQLTAVWEGCRDGYDRLAVAATGFNGLRRIEVLRMRARDVILAADKSEGRVWGKGANGGKYRTIPLSKHLYGALVALGKAGPEPFFPWRESAFDARLTAVGRLAGLPFNLSGHALRRTFGRLAYYAGVPLVSIQRIYGHASPVMTAHYIGIDLTEMAAGLELFERAMAVPVGV